jgi:hypothetical protein
LATEFYEEHGRPFRIAVDEAGWRFKNLNDYQVAKIQASKLISAVKSTVCIAKINIRRAEITST